MIRIFIGFDARETVAWHVLSHSILARASQPVSLVPLALPNLGPLMTRERNSLQSTDFSFSRFLTPYLSGYEAGPSSWTATCWCWTTSPNSGPCATTATP